MSKLLVLILVSLNGFKSFAEVTPIARINWKCIAGLNRYFAPYTNLPETQGTFEHFQIRSERIGNADVSYWDDTRPGLSTKVKSRHIFTSKGTYQCHYPIGLNPSDLVFDPEAIASGSANVLKRNRLVAARIDVTCRKTDLFPSELLNTYISSLPQLYGQLLFDKSGAENWTRISTDYTPQSVKFNGLQSCQSIPGDYSREIDRKIPRLQANWSAVQGENQSPTATEVSFGVD